MFLLHRSLRILPALFAVVLLSAFVLGPAVSELQRSGFTSSEVLRDAEGRFSIAISREPMPGNWLRMPENGRPALVPRLYDTPVAAGTAALDARTLPTIERLDCASRATAPASSSPPPAVSSWPATSIWRPTWRCPG